MAVTVAARISLTGSARNTANTLFSKNIGKMKISGISKTILRKIARNKLILAMAFDTGARNTEMCELTIDNVRENVILIHGKGNKERHVPLTPYLKKMLIKYSRIKDHYFMIKTFSMPICFCPEREDR